MITDARALSEWNAWQDVAVGLPHAQGPGERGTLVRYVHQWRHPWGTSGSEPSPRRDPSLVVAPSVKSAVPKHSWLVLSGQTLGRACWFP